MATQRKHDPVNHPSHYTDGKIEVINFINDKNYGFEIGNTIKYLSRAGKKDKTKTVEDLKKARWYLNHHIEITENTSIFAKIKRQGDTSKFDVLEFIEDKLSTEELLGFYRGIIFVCIDEDNFEKALKYLDKYINKIDK